jgi:D-alanyl-D-alanine carboxypeptidase (penicillin-binding protein 5/6)
LTAPLMKAVHLATVQVYQNNQLIQSIQINDNVQIQEANIFERFFMWFKGLFSLFGHDDRSVKLYPLN